MDAVLEYTSMSRMPGVFLEDGQAAAANPSLIKGDPMSLPQRMEGNRLHRFSKVLDTNIGQVHLNTRLLPPCHALKMAEPHPLNKTAPTNLYKAQKLMLLEGANMDSNNFELPHIVGVNIKGDPKDDLPHSVDDWLGDLMGSEGGGGGAGASGLEYGDYHDQQQHPSFWTMLGIFVLILSVCYVMYRYCRHTRRQLRARIMPARKKITSALNKGVAGIQMPTSPGAKNNV